MEISTSFSLAISFLAFVFIFLLRKTKTAGAGKALPPPPSPVALPIIGHLHLLKHPLHRTLHTLSQKYGPIFTLRLGSRLAVVVSSPTSVEECFTTNDVVFANRPPYVLSEYISSYASSTLGLAPYGDHWRNLRRLCAVEVLSPSRLAMSSGVRRDEIGILLRKLYQLSGEGFAKVKLKSVVSELSFNMIMRTVAGKRYYGEGESAGEEATRIIEMIEQSFQLGLYPADFLPFLKWFDTGFMKRVQKLSTEMDDILQNLVDKQRTNKGDCLISHLLTLQESQPEYYTDETIKGLTFTVLSGATESSSVTIEWAMSNLLNNPEVLKKARDELDTHIGQQRLLEEEQLLHLPYLQNVISESLRLNPAAPLLPPHMSSDSCSLGGYHIPPKTMLLVNAWAIHRDPQIWEDPMRFKPERFESGSDREGAGKFLPFGMGRRACPGMAMGNRVVALILGSLIQSFEWERVSKEKIDMVEGHGLTMAKHEPLEALCKPRPLMHKIASKF